jgi:flagellin
MTALVTAIDKIGAAASWNGSSAYGSFTIGAGQDAGDTYSFALSSIAGTSSTVANVDTVLANLATERAKAGAAVNALTHMGESMLAMAAAAAESRGRVEDTDYAEATALLARSQIIQQAATAMVAQANQQPSSVLALLQ